MIRPRRRQVWLALAAAPAALLVALTLGDEPAAAGRLDVALAGLQAGRPHQWLADFQAAYPGRVQGSAAHRDAPAAIASAFLAAGADAVDVERVAGQANVVARIAGTDRDAEVALVAHHDVVFGAPGAIDDGGAVAVLVEVAHALARTRPGCDVRLIAFDGEESGLLGAKAHVEALGPAGRERVRAAIALELVGWTDDRLVVHTIPSGFAWDAAGVPPAWLPAAVIEGGAAAGVPVGFGDPLVSPWYQGTIRVLGVRTGSDAGAYLERGVPAVMLTGSALTHFYAHYHQPTDDMTQVSAERLDDAARVALAAVWELAARPAIGRALGDAYLLLGRRRVGHGWIALLAALAALPAALAGLAIPACERVARGGLWTLSAALVGLGACGCVVGVWVGAPLALGLAAAACLADRRAQRAAVYAGLASVTLEAALMGGASAVFGFRWRGAPLETLLLAALALGTLGATQAVGALARSSR